jgi:hypothetical protein
MGSVAFMGKLSLLPFFFVSTFQLSFAQISEVVYWQSDSNISKFKEHSTDFLTRSVQAQTNSELIGFTQSGLVLDLTKIVPLIRKPDSLSDSLEELGLEGFILNERLFFWSLKVHSREALAKRKILWENLVSGKLGVDSLVSLKDVWPAVSQQQQYMKQEYGLSDESAGNLNALIGYEKVVTLESSDGRKRTFKVPNKVDPRRSDWLPFDRNSPASVQARESMENAPTSAAGYSIVSFGFKARGNEEFNAVSYLSKIIADEKDADYELSKRAWKQFSQKLESEDSELKGGQIRLTAEEQQQLDEFLSTLPGGSDKNQWKIISSEIAPTIRIKELVSSDSRGTVYGVTSTSLDRPVEPPSQKTIKP